LGPSIFKIFSLSLLDKIGGFNDLALAVVAFIIGSEIRISTLRKMGKAILTILFSEALEAVLLVGIGVYLLTHKLYMALIFGAMAAASAPAGTAVVLQEYKARGPLTNTLYAVVGFDDGLAIIIYAFSAALAKLFIAGGRVSFFNAVEGPLLEIVGALALGGLIAFVVGYFTKRLYERNELRVIFLGAILICTGLSKYFHFSLILSNLTLGIVFGNLFLPASRRVYQAIQPFTLPLYIIFFVTAGAHLQIYLLPTMGLLGLTYVLCRVVGKIGGAFFGATLSRSKPVIRRYLGLGLLSQAGVAIGLAILATREFSPLGRLGQDLALLVINTIAATTIIFEIIGPIGVKIAISCAGEITKSK
jgi:Kef-type K+ transport system membrane component KefB